MCKSILYCILTSMLSCKWNKMTSQMKKNWWWTKKYTEKTNNHHILVVFNCHLSSTGQDPWMHPLTENSIQLSPAPGLTFPSLHGTFTVQAHVSITRLPYHTCVLRPQPETSCAWPVVKLSSSLQAWVVP